LVRASFPMRRVKPQIINLESIWVRPHISTAALFCWRPAQLGQSTCSSPGRPLADFLNSDISRHRNGNYCLTYRPTTFLFMQQFNRYIPLLQVSDNMHGRQCNRDRVHDTHARSLAQFLIQFLHSHLTTDKTLATRAEPSLVPGLNLTLRIKNTPSTGEIFSVEV
jgi:hypothetical protein